MLHITKCMQPQCSNYDCYCYTLNSNCYSDSLILLHRMSKLYVIPDPLAYVITDKCDMHIMQQSTVSYLTVHSRDCALYSSRYADIIPGPHPSETATTGFCDCGTSIATAFISQKCITSTILAGGQNIILHYVPYCFCSVTLRAM